MLSASEALRQLTEKFHRNVESYLNPAYNEETTREEFINPLFDRDILGWDMFNRDGYAEAYKDVVHEGGLKGASDHGTSTFPDYTFRIGGTRKFFVEAKKPSVAIHEDAEAAFQLRRYAWSAKLPLSILTNFRELAVYDCRFKPQHTDKASAARILYLTYNQYQPQWNEISDVFSRQAILTGSFDKYAQSSKTKHGTTEVDAAFLNEIEKWREMLARSIALRNNSIDVFSLNFAVQRIIDRIIFLRMSEDRGIEEYDQLKSLTTRDNVYRRLQDIFEEADQKYNSGIFHFHREPKRAEPEDTLTPSLVIDDDVLNEIITNLYYPKSPYAFSVLGIDILGQVYEQFLGKVIRLTEGHRAKVEEKPEVKKAGGVYYTPSNIVQYIINHTIGELCKGKSPKEISHLRILDPACGSGSFLIAAYTFLLEFHSNWYVKAGAQKYQDQIYRGDDNQYYLTAKEKKRILLSHIFGVDKDSQAVEVTKLNLLLKVLEGERRETLELQRKLFRERALPDLGRNIAWGNSLIDPSFYSQGRLSEETDLLPIGFDWKLEFPTVFQEGGFSIIIGNPPYLKIEHLPEDEREYFQKHYERTYMKRYDAYALFLHKSTSLLREGGLLGMIIPSTILNNLTFTKLRKLLLDSTTITQIVNLGGKIFKNVNNDTLILLLKNSPTRSFQTEIFDVTKYGAGLSTAHRTCAIDFPRISVPPTYSFELRVTPDVSAVIETIRTDSVPLGTICETFQGLIAGNNEAFLVSADQINSEKLERSICKPIAFGDEVKRYGHTKPNNFVIYLTRENRISDFPNIQKKIEPFKNLLEHRAEGNLRPWYSLHRPRESANFERKPKLFVQCIRNLALRRRIVATIDYDRLYADHTLNIVYLTNSGYDLRYILGIVNSKLVNYLFQNKYVDINIKATYLDAVPIRKLNPNNPDQIRLSNNIIKKVDEILELTERLSKMKSPDETTILQRNAASASKEIDELIYELYSIPEKQRHIIDASLE